MVYMIVNLADDQLELHTDPEPDQRRYRTVQALVSGDVIPLTLDGEVLAQIPVEQFLPPED